jgi:hypothetical protein
MVRATYDVQMSFDAGVGPSGRIIPMTWTTVTDVVRDEGIRIHRGMADALARVAGPGTASFTLRNDAGNSGGLLGYYSTGHANCRSGFGYGMPARIIATYSGNTYVLFSGRIQIVDPTAGTYRDRRTRVVIVDMVGEWVDARLGDIDVALNASSFGLLGNVFAAIPDAVAPIALTGNGSTPDSFPYAFDDLGDGPGVLATIEKVVTSAYDKLYVATDDNLVHQSRGYLAGLLSQHTFTDSELDDLRVPTSLRQGYNRTRVTVHPRHIDAAATTVLFGINDAVSISPGETVTVWGTFRDPSNTKKLIGGTAAVTPLVSGTDYAANSVAAGGGTDLTAFIAVVATPFASTVKFDVTNSSGFVAYLVTNAGVPLLQIRGKGIYEDAPITAQSYSTNTTLGDQTLEVDMPYQSDANVAQDLADYLRTTFESLGSQVTSLTYLPEKSDTLMLQALQREITDVISVTEPVTARSASKCSIQSIDIEINRLGLARVTYGLAPFQVQQAWVLDSASYSQLDSTTIPAWAA